MTIHDWLVIFAILIAPILAVQVQKFLERRKEIKERKIQIFRTLMATRATTLDPQHVEALNMIDIEFFDDKKVTEKWKELLDNFANAPRPGTEAVNFWDEKNKDLLSELLYEMARSLNYDFDIVHLKRSAYIPKGHVDYMLEQQSIRESLLSILSGEKAISIDVVNMRDEKD